MSTTRIIGWVRLFWWWWFELSLIGLPVWSIHIIYIAGSFTTINIVNTKRVSIVYSILSTPHTNRLTIIDNLLTINRATRPVKTNPFHY
jgi:hypothetical protein